MRLDYWACDAKSGNVLGRLDVVGGSTLTSRFGGGDCSVSVSVGHLVTKDGRGPDFGAAARVLDQTQPGRRSILVTAGTRVIGEWWVLERALDSPSGVVALKGLEWDGYPALRSLNTNFEYKNVEQLTIARAAWNQAYLSFNTGMTITIPSSGSTGITRTMEHLSHEAYYSDVLDEMIYADKGFEWCVDISATWSQGLPTRAVRTIVWGYPVLSRASSLELVQATPGRPYGALVALGSGEDFTRYAQSVYGSGSGEGLKQRFVGLSDPSGTNAGYLNSTKNVSFPGIADLATLTALTKAELDRSQDIRDPYTAVARVDDLPTLPVVGNKVRIAVEPTWMYPTGLDDTFRVGQVEYSPDGHEATTVTVLAA